VNITLTPGLVLRPDFQLIMDPSGEDRHKPVKIVDAKLIITL